MKGFVGPQRLEGFFEQDAVTTFSGFVEEQTALRGADEFLKFRTASIGTDDWSFEVEEIVGAGSEPSDRVVVTLHQRGMARQRLMGRNALRARLHD